MDTILQTYNSTIYNQKITRTSLSKNSENVGNKILSVFFLSLSIFITSA